MRSLARVGLVVGLGALGGCSLLLDTGSLSGGSPPAATLEAGADAAPSDAAPGADADADAGAASSEAGSDAATDAEADAGPNLATNGDFKLGCDSWTVFQATATPDTTGRTDGSSCRVCSAGNGAGGSRALYQPILPSPAVGDSYTLSVWVRNAPAAPLTNPVTLSVLTSSDTVISSGGRPSASPTDAWSELTVDWTIGPGGATDGRIDVAIHDPTAVVSDDQCFLLDDVVIHRTK